ncbi:MAG: hypothetical protein JWO82_617 [Akkermansiaceae bacterium]|nr:hypothetical protein [Akkermansiaceae bacterium]
MRAESAWKATGERLEVRAAGVAQAATQRFGALSNNPSPSVENGVAFPMAGRARGFHAQGVNEEDKPAADWLAFLVQAAFGFGLGALMALYAIARSSFILPGSKGWFFGLGCSLTGAGITGYWGDRFWFGLGSNSVRGEAPRHSPVSIALSILLIAGGGALAAVSLYLNGS